MMLFDIGNKASGRILTLSPGCDAMRDLSGGDKATDVFCDHAALASLLPVVIAWSVEAKLLVWQQGPASC